MTKKRRTKEKTKPKPRKPGAKSELKQAETEVAEALKKINNASNEDFDSSTV